MWGQGKALRAHASTQVDAENGPPPRRLVRAGMGVPAALGLLLLGWPAADGRCTEVNWPDPAAPALIIEQALQQMTSAESITRLKELLAASAQLRRVWEQSLGLLADAERFYTGDTERIPIGDFDQAFVRRLRQLEVSARAPSSGDDTAELAYLAEKARLAQEIYAPRLAQRRQALSELCEGLLGLCERPTLAAAVPLHFDRPRQGPAGFHDWPTQSPAQLWAARAPTVLPFDLARAESLERLWGELVALESAGRAHPMGLLVGAAGAKYQQRVGAVEALEARIRDEELAALRRSYRARLAYQWSLLPQRPYAVALASHALNPVSFRTLLRQIISPRLLWIGSSMAGLLDPDDGLDIEWWATAAHADQVAEQFARFPPTSVLSTALRRILRVEQVLRGAKHRQLAQSGPVWRGRLHRELADLTVALGAASTPEAVSTGQWLQFTLGRARDALSHSGSEAWAAQEIILALLGLRQWPTPRLPDGLHRELSEDRTMQGILAAEQTSAPVLQQRQNELHLVAARSDAGAHVAVAEQLLAAWRALLRSENAALGYRPQIEVDQPRALVSELETRLPKTLLPIMRRSFALSVLQGELVRQLVPLAGDLAARCVSYRWRPTGQAR